MGEDADNNPVAPVTEVGTMGAEAAEAPPIWKPALKEAGWAFAAAAIAGSIPLNFLSEKDAGT